MQDDVTMNDARPIILWFRRDFRLSDHPALAATARTGRRIIPVFVLDEVVEAFGAAPAWRLGEALREFGGRLETLGSRLTLRRGRADEELLALAREVSAGSIWWSRAYDPDAIERDTRVKSSLRDAGFDARSFAGHLLFEPWDVKTKQGGFFKVYSPMWRAVRDQSVSTAEPAPTRLTAPKVWPESDRLDDWSLGNRMNRGAGIVAGHACVGEARALSRLERFLEVKLNGYLRNSMLKITELISSVPDSFGVLY